MTGSRFKFLKMQESSTVKLQTGTQAATAAPSRPAVIINASSGTDNKSRAREILAQTFASSGIEARISLAESGEEIIELARSAVRDNCQPIIAGGGDGTINAVASVLLDTDRTLGVLPLGTLNHFAKDLHIPLDIEQAAQVSLSGREASVDVGEVNGRIFLNNSSLGLYPSIVRHRERQQQQLGRGKWPAFLWATLSMLKRYPFLNVRLSTDEERMIRRTPFVFVGNNEYEMESFNIGARSCIDAGQLSLYVAHRTSRLGLLRLAWRALFGGLRDEEDFNAMCTKEVWIETRRPKRLRVATDGEVTTMTTPLHYRVRPGALRVLVPKESSE
ncbi:MAG TPA: diacylglycerol kinase family protein [Pyrinomonadaceae bacterium]|nr:diacylglycerol kinase family protein [Pyrinomonadaceae bacterium]